MAEEHLHHKLGIEAEVFSKFWSATGPNPMNPGAPTFFVCLRIRNASSSDVCFEKGEGAFVNARGQGLRVNARAGAEGKWKIGSGESLAIEFDTNGYTSRVLEDARHAPPLQFHFSAIDGDQVIGGPWAAPLPPLDSLSLFYDENDPFSHLQIFPPELHSRQGGGMKYSSAGVVLKLVLLGGSDEPDVGLN